MLQTFVEAVQREYVTILPDWKQASQAADELASTLSKLGVMAVGLMVAAGVNEHEALETVLSWGGPKPPF